MALRMVTGRVEALGNAHAKAGATYYGLIRLLSETGEEVFIERAAVGSRVDSYLESGNTVTLYYVEDPAAHDVTSDRYQMVFGIETDGRRVHDIDRIDQTRKALRSAGITYVICGIPLCLIILGFKFVFHGLKTLRDVSAIPSRRELLDFFERRPAPGATASA